MWIQNENSGKWQRQVEGLDKEVFNFLRQELDAIRFYSKCLDGTSYLPIDNLDNIYDVLNYTNEKSWYVDGDYTLPIVGDLPIDFSTSDTYKKYLEEYGFTLKNLFTPKRTIDDQLDSFLQVDVATTESISVNSILPDLIIDGIVLKDGHRLLVKNQFDTVILPNTTDPDDYFISNYFIQNNDGTNTTYTIPNGENGVYTYELASGLLTKTTEFDEYEDAHRYSVHVKLGTQNLEKQFHLSRLTDGYYPMPTQPTEFTEKHNWLLRNLVEYNNVLEVNYRDVIHHEKQSELIPERSLAVGDFGQINIEQHNYLGIIKNEFKADLNGIDESKDFYWVVGDEGTVLKIDKVQLSIEKLEFDDILNFNSISFITNTRGIFVGEFGSIFYTFNSGKKWEQITIEGFETFSMNQVLWYDANTAYVVGDNGIFVELSLVSSKWVINKIPVLKVESQYDSFVILDNIMSVEILNTSNWNLVHNYTTTESVEVGKEGIVITTNKGDIYIYDKNNFLSDYHMVKIETNDTKSIKKVFTKKGVNSFSQRPSGFVEEVGSGARWDFLANATGQFDNLYATCELTTELDETRSLAFHNFNFNIPNDAIINGIEVVFDKIGPNPSDGSINDKEVYLSETPSYFINGGSNLAKSEKWPATPQYHPVYGSSTEMWNKTWTPTILNSSEFSVQIKVNGISGNPTFGIDGVKIKVHYTSNDNKLTYMAESLKQIDLNDFVSIDENTNIINGTASVILSENSYNNGHDISSDFSVARLVGNKGLYEGYNGSVYNIDPTFSGKQKSRLLFLDYDIGSKLNFFDSDMVYRLPEPVNIDSNFELRSVPGLETPLTSVSGAENNFGNIPNDESGSTASEWFFNNDIYENSLTYSGGDPSKTDTLVLFNLGLNVPLKSTIKGIEVSFTKESDRRRTTEDIVMISTTTTEDKGDSENRAIEFPEPGHFWYPINDSTYGSAEDTWGLSLYPEMVNSPEFNIKIRTKTDYVGDVNLEVQDLVVKVYYAGTVRNNHNWLDYFKDENRVFEYNELPFVEENFFVLVPPTATAFSADFVFSALSPIYLPASNEVLISSKFEKIDGSDSVLVRSVTNTLEDIQDLAPTLIGATTINVPPAVSKDLYINDTLMILKSTYMEADIGDVLRLESETLTDNFVVNKIVDSPGEPTPADDSKFTTSITQFGDGLYWNNTENIYGNTNGVTSSHISDTKSINGSNLIITEGDGKDWTDINSASASDGTFSSILIEKEANILNYGGSASNLGTGHDWLNPLNATGSGNMTYSSVILATSSFSYGNSSGYGSGNDWVNAGSASGSPDGDNATFEFSTNNENSDFASGATSQGILVTPGIPKYFDYSIANFGWGGPTLGIFTLNGFNYPLSWAGSNVNTVHIFWNTRRAFFLSAFGVVLTKEDTPGGPDSFLDMLKFTGDDITNDFTLSYTPTPGSGHVSLIDSAPIIPNFFGTEWIDSINATSSNGLTSYNELYDGAGIKESQWLGVNGFDLNIPSGSQIDGIEVTIKKKSTGNVIDNEVYLSNDIYNLNKIGDNKKTDLDYPLNSTHFLNTDDNIGWAVGDNGYALSTIDGGSTWTEMDLGTMSNLNNVFIRNATDAWIVGDGGTLLRTIDGGSIWTSLVVTTEDINSITISGSDGWIVCSNGVIYKTTDNGTSWLPLSSSVTSNLLDITTTDGVNIYITSDVGEILLSTDGGGSWGHQIPTLASSSINAIEFIYNGGTATNGYAVSDDGKVASTTDSGVTWNSVGPWSVNNFNDVQFVSATAGWIVGDNGTIFNTIDGGVIWNDVSIGGDYDFNKIFVNPSIPNEITIVGGNGDGIIYQTIDGGSTWDSYIDWESSLTSQIYGGSNDMWGTNLTTTELNDPNFGILIKPEALTNLSIAEIDSVNIKVHYTILPKYLGARDFGFNLPSDAIITGYKVDIRKKGSNTYSPISNIFDAEVYLAENVTSQAALSDNKADSATWSTSLTTTTYGDTNDTWGTSYTLPFINSSLFGVLIKPSTPLDIAVAEIDSIEVGIYYRIPSKSLGVYGYDFNLPSEAIITGIEATIYKKSEYSDTIVDSSVYLSSDVGNSILLGDNYGTTSSWSDALTGEVYGATDSNWGATLSSSILNDSNFGLIIQPEVFGTSSNDGIAYIDSVDINVFYSVPIKNITFQEFGFSIPSDATITGIEAFITKKGSGVDTIIDEQVYLLSNVGSTSSLISDNLSSTASWSATSSIDTYGSIDNDWGIPWTPALLNTPNFGLTIKPDAIGATGISYIDDVELSVSYTRPKKYLVVSGFDFSLPTEADITGIEVKITKSASVDTVFDDELYLSTNVSVPFFSTTNEADSGTWSSSLTTTTYGGPTYSWGYDWNADEINNPSFGLLFKNKSFAVESISYIDSIEVNVHYLDIPPRYLYMYGRLNENISNDLVQSTNPITFKNLNKSSLEVAEDFNLHPVADGYEIKRSGVIGYNSFVTTEVDLEIEASDKNWIDITNVTDEADVSYTHVSGATGSTSSQLVIGFDNLIVPPSSLIKGVEVKVYRKADDIIIDDRIFLSFDDDDVDIVGDNKASQGLVNGLPSSIWSSTDEVVVYGSPTDDWGLDINDRTFDKLKLNIRTFMVGESTAYIDAIELILYTETVELSAKFNNKTAYYNMETLVFKPNKYLSMLYEDTFLSFGYTPQYNIMDYLQSIGDYSPNKRFNAFPRYYNFPEGNGSVVAADNKLTFHEDRKFEWDTILPHTFYDISAKNNPEVALTKKTIVMRKYFSIESGRYIIEFDKEINTPGSGVDVFDILGRNSLLEISEDLQELNNITKPERSVQFAQFSYKSLTKSLGGRFNTDSYAKILLSDNNIKDDLTGVIYTDYKNELALNIIQLEQDVELTINNTIDVDGKSAFVIDENVLFEDYFHELNIGDRVFIKAVGASQSIYDGMVTIQSFPTQNSFTTDKNYVGDTTGTVILQKFDPFLNYRPSDIIDVGISAEAKVGIEILDKNIVGRSLVDVDFNNVKFRLVDDMDLTTIKDKYPWLLEAEMRNAYIGLDQNGPVWYDGTWLCGRWFQGTWYKGIWRDGEWYGGEWNSVETKVTAITGEALLKFRDNKYSKWFRGNHHVGTWNNGTWYDGRWITGTWNDGDWFRGQWDTGDWNNGNFQGGLWIDGTWNDGIFSCHKGEAFWLDGIWNAGDFECGEWFNGNFNQDPSKISRFGTKPTNFRKAIWHAGDWTNGEFHALLNYGDDGKIAPATSENNKLSQWKTGKWNNGTWYGGTTFNIDWTNGLWSNGVSNFIKVKSVIASSKKITLEGIFRFQEDTSFWIIDDNIDLGYSSVGSNTTPTEYIIRSVEVFEETNITEIIVYDDDNTINVSAPYPTNTGLVVVSNFFSIEWNNGVFMNGIFEGEFNNGIWLNGVFIDGGWGLS